MAAIFTTDNWTDYNKSCFIFSKTQGYEFTNWITSKSLFTTHTLLNLIPADNLPALHIPHIWWLHRKQSQYYDFWQYKQSKFKVIFHHQLWVLRNEIPSTSEAVKKKNHNKYLNQLIKKSVK